MRTFTFSYSSLLPSKFNNRVVCISISRPVCDSSLHTSPLCLEGFLRSERISLLLWLQKHAERFQSNQPVWRLIKANIRMAGDTSPPQKISNETQQLSWFTSFATVKKTPRKHPLYSGCASKSALMNVTLIGVLIGSMFDVGTFCHFSHTDGWSQTSAPNRLSLHRETMFALYCPAAFKNILIILRCKVRKTF